MNNNKRYFYTSIWNKYIPIIRILIKKSAATEQILNMNRIDFERAGYARKSGYKFTVNFENSRSDTIFTGNELIQTFIAALHEDEVIQEHLMKNDYTFMFTGKFILHIRNNTLIQQPETEAEALADHS